ncbi:acyltransferase [Suilimivivens sp.]|uniref:acyltransferase n=1 Tax=Suilimivivens sp. TaxID=2981669 RepID=UPI00306FF67C
MKNSVQHTRRNSNLELLRIIAMYMIVFIHANLNLSTFCGGKSMIFFNGLVNGICNIGVTCFILISGYYGVQFKLKKLVKMECMMISYSLLEILLMYLVMPEQLQGAALLEQLVKSLLPFISRKYWFYSCYVCLMLLSGYIQKLIDALKQEEMKKLLILMIILFGVLPTIFYFELIPDNGKGLVQMIMVYMIGRYIRSYYDRKLQGKAIIVFIGLWIINGISHELPIQIGGIYHHLCKDNSITNLTMAVILFFIFKNWKFQSGIINHLAKNIFAVFALNNTLIACVMKILRENNLVKQGAAGGFLMLAGIVFIILVGCLLIGSIRELMFGKLDEKLGNMIEGIERHVKTKFI